MTDILMSETCWVHKKWNKIASDIKLVFCSSTITMMHGPRNISFKGLHPLQKHWKTDCEKTNMLGDNRNIWCAHNLCVSVQLEECSAATHPSHGKTIRRTSEENAYELLTKISVILKLFKQYMRVHMCTHIHSSSAHVYMRVHALIKGQHFQHIL